MYDVIVIGAGPAGIMASISSALNNKKVLLIEKNDRIGRKLFISGGSRCNLTNLKDINSFIEEIPVNNKSLYSVLNQFGPHDIYNYFTKLGVTLKIEDDDKVFPASNKSTTIIDTLYEQLKINGVTVNFNEMVERIDNKTNLKEVITNKGVYKAEKVIIATGGCSYPETGSTGDGYKLAKMINQKVTNLYPAETFLITEKVLPLAGITVSDVIISFNKKHVQGSLLFTHIGLSGPAIFKISEEVYKQLKDNEVASISIDLLPNYNIEELISKLNNYDQKEGINGFLKPFLPKKLGDYIIDFTSIPYNLKICSLSKIKKEELIHNLKNFKIDIKETGTISQGLVTGGGIDMKYINSKTMESTVNKGIYFVGEVLDIHGPTGGYNITIALSTGYAAGNEK